MEIFVEVLENDEKWSCGDLKADSAFELARKIVDTARAVVQETEQTAGTECDGDMGVYYAHADAEVYLLGEKIGDVDIWQIAGFVAPGASMDIDGSGLSLWGDSQHGEWSVCQRDGQSRGDEEVDAAILSALENADVIVTDKYPEDWKAWWIRAASDVDIDVEICFPTVNPPEDEEIAKECTIRVIYVSGESVRMGGEVAIGFCLGTKVAARWRQDGSLEEVEIHASRGDVQRMIEAVSEELSDAAREIAQDITWPEE